MLINLAELGHSGNKGNQVADEVVRQASKIFFDGPEPIYRLSYEIIKGTLKLTLPILMKGTGENHSKPFLYELSVTKTKQLFKIGRNKSHIYRECDKKYEGLVYIISQCKAFTRG